MAIIREIDNSIIEPNEVLDVHQKQKMENGVSETTEEQDCSLPHGHLLNCQSALSATAAHGFSSLSTETHRTDLCHPFLRDCSAGHEMLGTMQHCQGHMVVGRVSEEPQENFFRELRMADMIFNRLSNQWRYYIFQWHQVSIWNNSVFMVLKFSSILLVHIDDAKQPASDPVTAEYTQENKGIKLMSESLALISDTKLKASNPVAAEDREKDKGKGSSVELLALANNPQQTTSDPATAECIQHNERKGSSVDSLALANNVEQTSSAPAIAECTQQIERKLLSIKLPALTSDVKQPTSSFATAKCTQEIESKGPLADSPALASVVEQSSSTPAAAAECVHQFERKGPSMESLPLTSDVEQTASDPATAECIQNNERKGSSIDSLALANNVEQTSSAPAIAEFTQQIESKGSSVESLALASDVEQTTLDPVAAECIEQGERKGPLEPNEPVSDHSFAYQNFSHIDVKSVVCGILILSLLTSSEGFIHGNHVSCAVNSNADLTDWKLVCHFQEDVNKSRKHFQAFHMRHENTPELVLDALWEGNKPYVYTAPGYSHDGLISDKVEVRMQLNVIHHGAMYICILPSEKLEEMRTCEIPKIRGQNARLTDTAEHFTSNTGWKPAADRKMLALLLLIAALAI